MFVSLKLYDIVLIASVQSTVGVKSEADFKASSGWLHRFKSRHGIRQLSMQGESLSANPEAAEEFKKSLHTFTIMWKSTD